MLAYHSRLHQPGTVESRHALIEQVEEDRYLLRDMHTQSGTFINDTRMRRDGAVPLQHGDALRFGRHPEVCVLLLFVDCLMLLTALTKRLLC